MRKILFLITTISVTVTTVFLSSEYFEDIKRDKLWKSQLSRIVFANEWNDIIYNKDLRISGIDENDWSYPWYIVKDEDGELENTLGDEITKEDTIKIIHNSKCYTFKKDNETIKEDTISRLPFGEISRDSDKIWITLSDKSASNWEVLTLELNESKYRVSYNTSFVFPYDTIYFNIENQHLELNLSEPYKKGDVIKGFVKTDVTRVIVRENGKKSDPYTKLIEGTFEIEMK